MTGLFSITNLIIAATALISFQAFRSERMFSGLLMHPYSVRSKSEWYRMITHAFVHADWAHLLVNMFVLYSFGNLVEVLYGRITTMPAELAYLLLYFGGAVYASLPGLFRHGNDPAYRAVGASGAVSAVLFAAIMLLPTQKIGIIFIPFQLPAYVFGLLYLLYSWYMDRRGGDHVAHDAHLHGAIFGVLFSTALDPDLLFDLGSFERSLGS